MLTTSQIKSLIKLLHDDKIVIIPTDTIYGFSAKNSLENQTKINQLKNAPLEKSLITLVSNQKQLSELVEPKHYTKFLELLDQGVTLIFPYRKNTRETIAVRLIKRPDLVELINQSGPLWSTSVNYHGSNNIDDLKEIKIQFPEIPIFENGKQLKSSPSKIYDTLNSKWLR